jgi:uncharacterized protein YidB (DUF937 family)
MNWIARLLDLFSFKFAPASTAVVERRNEADQVLLLLQDHFRSRGGIAQTLKGFERAGFIGKVRSWRGEGPLLPINSVEALQLFGWKDLQNMSKASGISVDRLRDLIAELLPVAVRRACAAA